MLGASLIGVATALAAVASVATLNAGEAQNATEPVQRLRAQAVPQAPKVLDACLPLGATDKKSRPHAQLLDVGAPLSQTRSYGSLGRLREALACAEGDLVEYMFDTGSRIYLESSAILGEKPDGSLARISAQQATSHMVNADFGTALVIPPGPIEPEGQASDDGKYLAIPLDSRGEAGLVSFVHDGVWVRTKGNYEIPLAELLKVATALAKEPAL